MKTSTRQDIFEYVTQESQVSPAQLAQKFQLSGVMIHRHLQHLLQEGKVMKLGQPPRVWYVPAEKPTDTADSATSLVKESKMPEALFS